ncbi:uncharacterized protein LOC128205811 [Mya arenaria]|uniref:uncharacterized protein LOC128205811 n=1 Tax=Mya arenaria TaxID=6604 RepID=UPI0022E197A2|nr:uncharacterized protein LOC128205811 [Mya arenaria]XP_052763734.1 uncharacterized protein LOC128205811 [Mya arenaria]
MGHQEMAVERSKLCRKLLQLRDDSEYQDVTIIASGKHIPAHKCILSVGSVFFNVLLQKCKSSSSGKRTDTVHLANINSDDLLYLEDTINFIYAGEIEISRTNFTSIFRLASYLVVKDLLDLCEMYLRQNLNVENCLQFYLDLCSLTDNSDSHLKLDQEIVSLAREMVEVNFYTAILPGDEILQVTEEDLLEIFSEGIVKNFSISSVLVFVKNWIEERTEESEVLVTVLNIVNEKLPVLTRQDDIRIGITQNLTELKELKDVTKANIQDDSTQKEILTALDDVENTLTSSLSDRGLNSDVGDVRDSKNTDGKATDIPKETMPTDNNRNVRNETEADDHFTKPSEAADLDKGLESDNVKQNTPTEHLDSGEKLKDGNHINDRSKEPIAVSDNEEYSKDDKEEHSKDDKESTPLKKSDEGSVDLVNICTDDIAGKNLTNDTEDTSKNNPREIAEVVDYHSDSDTDDVEMVESSPQFATQLYTGALSAYRNRTRSAGSLSEHDRTFLDRVNACMKLQPSLTIPKQKRTLASRTPLKSPTIHPKAKKKEQVEFVSKKIKIEPVHDSDDIDAAAENDDSNNETYLNINSIDNTLIQGDMNIKHEQEENQDHRAIAVSTKPKPASTQGAKKRKSVPRKKTLISCDVCGKVFTRRYRLTDHMRSHDGIKKFRCIECGKLFTRNDHVLRHMQKKHFDVEVFTCDVCSDTFRSINEIVSHLAKHLQDDALTEDALLSRFSEKYKERSFAEVKADGGRVYGCKICAKTYNKPYRLRDHLDVHLGIKTDCPECGESFSNKKTMSKHYSNIHAKSENGWLTCPQCKKKYKSEEVFEMHISICERAHKCDQCTAEFYTSNHLKRHIETIHNKVNYPCEVCTKTFATKYRRDHHFQVVHEGKKKLVKSVICDVCGLSFDGTFKLKRHMSIHTGIKQHKCEKCGKQYLDLASLKNHIMQIHDNIRPYVCEICAMEFTVKSNMLRHQRRHRGEYHFFCDDCGKGFVANCDLTRHKLTHKPDKAKKKHACKYCGKLFTRASKVQVHERIHTGERPYECSLCQKKFTQSGDRNRHETKAHGIEHTPRPTLFEMANDAPNPNKFAPDSSTAKELSYTESSSFNRDEQDLMQLAVLTDVGMRIPAFSRDNSAGYTRDQVQAAYGVASDMQQKPEEMIGSTPIKTFNFPNGNY